MVFVLRMAAVPATPSPPDWPYYAPATPPPLFPPSSINTNATIFTPADNQSTIPGRLHFVISFSVCIFFLGETFLFFFTKCQPKKLDFFFFQFYKPEQRCSDHRPNFFFSLAKCAYSFHTWTPEKSIFLYVAVAGDDIGYNSKGNPEVS